MINFAHDKSMSLDGGIDTYTLNGGRYKTDISPFGRKVTFKNSGGYDIQLEQARKLFKEGQVLTVKEIYVGRNSSEVEFIEVLGQTFNTVMFADVD